MYILRHVSRVLDRPVTLAMRLAVRLAVQLAVRLAARVRGLAWTENRLLRGLLSVFLLFYALRGPSHALRGRST